MHRSDIDTGPGDSARVILNRIENRLYEDWATRTNNGSIKPYSPEDDRPVSPAAASEGVYIATAMAVRQAIEVSPVEGGLSPIT